ncbi:MAG: hypothetical protein R2939_09720 [Kofleriaceae bacterium]
MVAPVRSLRQLLASWRGRFIAVFLALQVALPLGYYLVRRDRRDERWAWRMFSPTRLDRCEPVFSVGGRPQPLGGEFHEAWIEIARRGRRVVLEAMAARLCAAHPGQDVRLAMTCTTLDGRRDAVGGFDLCQLPEL